MAIAFALVRIRRCFGDARGGGHPRRDTQPLDSGDSLSTAHDALGIVATQSNHNSPYVTSHFAPSATSAIGLPRTSPFGQEIIGPWKTPAIHLIAPYHRHNKFRYLLLRATTLLLRFTPSTASRTCGPPANATVSLRRRQFDLRHAQGQIRSIESFHAERLQSKALLGAADKHIGAEPDRPGHLCCCPDVSARQVTG